jgi:hypothetical protein
MLRSFLASFFSLMVLHGYGQLYSISVGVYTGITVPYTLDKGLDADARYKSKYTVKAAPIGIQFGMDYENLGFQISPGLYTIGQNYYVINNAGGQVGDRTINLRYAALPAAFKIHLIDLSFFRVSALATGSVSFLLDAQDRLSHEFTKLRFSNAYPSLPEGYSPEYDGVVSPVVNNLEVSQKEDYNKIQVFAGLGLCSDWNVTEHWRLSFDFRINYGFLEPRSQDYLDRIKKYESIYDMPGKRTDSFAQLSFSVSRFLDFDKGDKDRAKRLKGTSRKYTPSKPMKPQRRR